MKHLFLLNEINLHYRIDEAVMTSIRIQLVAHEASLAFSQSRIVLDNDINEGLVATVEYFFRVDAVSNKAMAILLHLI